MRMGRLSDMPARTVKLDNDEALDICTQEGLGYAQYGYCKGDSFEDPITAGLWDIIGGACDALVAYLQQQTGREVY